MSNELITGKNKEQFKDWFRKKKKEDFSLMYTAISGKGSQLFDIEALLLLFECSPKEMKVGVLMEYYEHIEADQHGFVTAENEKELEEMGVIDSMIYGVIELNKIVNKLLEK